MLWAAEWVLSITDMLENRNATSEAHEASTIDVMESLKICKELLEHSWQSGQSGRVVWQDALNTAIE